MAYMSVTEGDVMKQTLCLVALFLSFMGLSAAASCSNGSLASYIALGSGGCTIGGNTYSSFADLSGSAGATEIPAIDVMVAPSGGKFNPALTFTVNVTSPLGTINETMFNYSVKGTPYVSEVVTLSNSSEPGGGDVSDVTNYCEGGPFGPDGVTGCMGMTGGTALLDPIQNQSMLTFGAPYFLSLTDDLTIDGTSGSAMGGKITDQLNSVPEPAPLLITAIGLSLFVTLKSRLSRRG